MFSKTVRASVLAVAAGAIGILAVGAANAQSRQSADFFALLDKLEAHNEGLTYAIVDETLGGELYPYWTDYNAENAKTSKLKLGNTLAYSVDYKGATRSNPAVRNSVVTFKVDDGCIAKSDVMAKYPDLAPVEKAPPQPGTRPARLTPTQSLMGKKVSWGDLMFRFDSAKPDCLDAALISFVATDF